MLPDVTQMAHINLYIDIGKYIVSIWRLLSMICKLMWTLFFFFQPHHNVSQNTVPRWTTTFTWLHSTSEPRLLNEFVSLQAGFNWLENNVMVSNDSHCADKINLEHISSHFQYLQLFPSLAYRHKRVITFIRFNPLVCPVSINIRRKAVLKYCPHIWRVSGKNGPL